MLGKPHLYVDVDGVISLWGFDHGDSDRRPVGGFISVDGIPHFLSEEAGRHLLDLASEFELMWCTGWEEKANEVLVGHIGLPGPLPVVELDRHREAGHTTPGHWKLGALERHAGGAPLAWIDDALNEACHAWAQGRSAPTLLVETDPATGLVERHAAQLRSWAASLQAS
jgi:hypothetical protein